MLDKVKKLFESDISSYRISRESGVPENTVRRLRTGQTNLQDATYKNIEMLYNYYEEEFEMTQFEKLNAMNSTVVEVEGVEYKTTQDPYVTDAGDQYQAHAVDADDKEYLIIWDVVNEDVEDESDACDWDEPSSVVAY